MKKTFILPVLGWIVIAGLSDVSAQQNTTASGGESSGSGGTVSYSTGQVDYITATGTGGTASQGVEQPYEIFSTGVNDPSVMAEAVVFPNPAENYILISVPGLTDPLTGFLYDAQGKLILQQTLFSSTTRLQISHLSNGTYFLKINNSENEIKTFTIIKNR